MDIGSEDIDRQLNKVKIFQCSRIQNTDLQKEEWGIIVTTLSDDHRIMLTYFSSRPRPGIYESRGYEVSV